VVERRHQRKKQDSIEREKEKTELGGGSPCEGRGPEVAVAVQEHVVRPIPAEPDWIRVGESGAIHEPLSGHDRGSLHRQRWQAVFRSNSAALEVGQREYREADEGGESHRETPRDMEGG